MAKKTKKEKFVKRIWALFEWILYILGYTLVFMCINMMFDSFIVDENHFYLYSFIAVILIYILNKTVKPILFKMTLPITGLTLGLFYFVNNMIILKLVEFIMNNKIEFTSLPVLFIISIIFSIFNLIVEDFVVKPFIKKVKVYE